MNSKRENHQRTVSKFLSLTLRHQPGSIGLTLDAQGWADVPQLIKCAAKHGVQLSMPLLREVVANNDKQRFTLDEENQRIRANQGHSVKVDLGFTPKTPPEFLYHGTASHTVESIRRHGLSPQSRLHVHLSATRDTARTVGARHGKPVVLTIKAGELAQSGHLFYLSENGVWLTENVPASAIYFPDPST